MTATHNALTSDFKMLSMHLPRGAVEIKMQADGKDPALLDNPDAPSPNASGAAAAAPAGPVDIFAEIKEARKLKPRSERPSGGSGGGGDGGGGGGGLLDGIKMGGARLKKVRNDPSLVFLLDACGLERSL